MDEGDNMNESLLVEILARLPCREAIQLKLVCKQWCSLISSNYFITVFNHRRHGPVQDHDHDSSSISLVFNFNHTVISPPEYGNSFLVRCGYTQGAAKLLGLHKLDLSFLPCPRYEVEFKASCADLILCSSSLGNPNPNLSRTEIFYVCNLQTKQWVALPPAPHFEEYAIGFLCIPSPCSLSLCQCVDNSRCKFMVVQIYRYGGGCVSPSQFNVGLFSSEEGQWRTRVVSSPRPFNIRRLTHCVAYKGMLHWLTSGCVVVYDPYNAPERFSRVIDLPFDSQCPLKSHSFGLYRDRLRAVQLNGNDGKSYHVWELEDYNLGKWCLVHKINAHEMNPVLENTEGDYYRIVILYVLPDGNVVYLKQCFSLWLRSSQNEMTDHHYRLFDCIPRKFGHGLTLFPMNVHQMAHQIIDQWWPTPVPSLPLNMQPGTFKRDDMSMINTSLGVRRSTRTRTGTRKEDFIYL